MMEELLIVLPLPARVLHPNCTIGSFGGRMMKAAAVKKCRRVTAEAIEAEQIETIPWEKAKVTARFYYKTKRKRDQDNAMGALKAVYDGIVDSGLCVDDDWEHMNRGVPEILIDRDHPRVELTITRLA